MQLIREKGVFLKYLASKLNLFNDWTIVNAPSNRVYYRVIIKTNIIVFLVHEMRPEDIGIVGFRGDPDKQPFMVGYFKSSGIRESKVRQKRDARRRKKSESSSLDYRNNPYTGKSGR